MSRFENYRYRVHDNDEPPTNEGRTLVVSDSNDGWGARMYEPDGGMTTYRTSCFKSKERALEMFAKHRPMCTLEPIDGEKHCFTFDVTIHVHSHGEEEAWAILKRIENACCGDMRLIEAELVEEYDPETDTVIQ